MTSTANGRVVPGQLESFGVPPFDGYPYLVTRIGHSALRHLALLPADWSRERLVDLARRQRDANRLDTCVVLGRHDVRGFDPSRKPSIARRLAASVSLIEGPR